MKEGWKVKGIEPSETARVQAKQKGINTEASIDHLSGTFQLITLWHVLEHVPDLNETLHKLYKLLEPNGTLLIAVPNHTSLDALKYKQDWAGYDVPRHLWHFNQQTMQQLLQKHAFTLENTLPLTLDSFYVSLLSETYQEKKILKFVNAFLTGLRSNLSALKTKEYSSLIYLARK